MVYTKVQLHFVIKPCCSTIQISAGENIQINFEFINKS